MQNGSVYYCHILSGSLGNFQIENQVRPEVRIIESCSSRRGNMYSKSSSVPSMPQVGKVVQVLSITMTPWSSDLEVR